MKRNRIISILLCAAMAFTGAGCAKTPAASSSATGQNAGISANSAQPPQGAVGRWVEEKIDLGIDCDVMTTPREMPDGTLRLYARGIVSSQEDISKGVPVYQIESKDGGATWNSVPCVLNDAGCTFLGRAVSAPNGGALFYGLTLGQEANSRNYGLFYATPEGKIQPVLFDPENPIFTPSETNGAAYEMELSGSLAPMYDGQPQVLSIGFLSDNLAYANTMSIPKDGKTIIMDASFLFDPTTGEIKAKIEAENELQQGTLSCPASYAGGLFHMTYESDGSRTLYEVAPDGNVTLRIAGLEAARNSLAGCADDAGNYYFLSMSGIYRVASGGTLAEVVVDSTGFSFSSEAAMAVPDGGLSLTKDGSFYAAMNTTGTEHKNELYRYRFDTTLPAVNETAITVWSLTDNATVRAALVEYAKANTDITVNYTVGMSAEGQDLNKEDVLRALNTQILSGTGPDVLILDELDAAAYARKGLLVDLSAQVNADGLVPWVKSAYYKPGETYVMPARFSVPIVVGPSDSIAQISSLKTLQEAILARPPRPVMDGSAGEIYYAPLPDSERYGMGFISVAQLTQFALQASASSLVQDGTVNTVALKEVLSFIEAVGNHSNMKDYLPSFTTNKSAIGSGDSDTIVCDDGGYEFSFTGNAVYAWDMIDTPAYLYDSYQPAHDDPNSFHAVSAIVQPGTVQGAYRPRTLLAVSAATKNQDAALSFAQTMLGENVQNGFYQDGMPILQTALDASIARNGSTQRMAERNVKTDIKAFFATLQTPVVQDSIVEEKVAAHAEALIAGRETLDAAVAGTQQDLALYLAERG